MTPNPDTTTTPAQRTVASYPSYTAAQQAVDHLSGQRFPVEHVAIAGRGLHSYEQVTGRLTLARAAGYHAAAGAVLGAMFGWLLGLLDLVNPLVSALLLAVSGAIIGAVGGALLRLAAHALTGGRDFASIGGLRADSYEVLVDDTQAEHAARLLTTPDTSARS